ncbi:hypothetical protein NX059_002189 [Plenodomus lindquistii]|nr:hypothetical protein NX059_002189 [Plenodomus lindquistii]
MACKSLFAAEPRELSLLYVLTYIAAAGNETTPGNLNRLLAFHGGGQEKRIVGGTGFIAERLAAQIGKTNIALNAAVSCVKKTNKRYRYEITSRRGTVYADSVILALAPPLLQNISFEPSLPSARRNLISHMFMPAIAKAIAIYHIPFWRFRSPALNAQVLSDTGVVRLTFDSTPHDSSFGALLGFILADEMRGLDLHLPNVTSTAQSAILSDYTRYLGAQASGSNVLDFVLFRWDREEWSRGGPAAIAAPGLLAKYGFALRERVGGLHFAGTETAEYWMGYMEGAIRSGERAAREILAERGT